MNAFSLPPASWPAESNPKKFPPPLRLTTRQAIDKFGPSARKQLHLDFDQGDVKYPPEKISLVCLKQEKILLFYASDKRNPQPQLLYSFPLSSFSGKIGPKLKEGDLQIPEGFYRVLNQRADMRLALCVDYPNSFDREKAKQDRRKNLGSDILVHGGSYSTGCVVISSEDMAKVFTAVYDCGCSNTSVLIAPCNLSTTKPDVDFKLQPIWLPSLYMSIKQKLSRYKIPERTAILQSLRTNTAKSIVELLNARL